MSEEKGTLEAMIDANLQEIFELSNADENFLIHED